MIYMPCIKLSTVITISICRTTILDCCHKSNVPYKCRRFQQAPELIRRATIHLTRFAAMTVCVMHMKFDDLIAGILATRQMTQTT